MLRIVVTHPGPDPQDHAAAVLARALRDAGHEVIWAGSGRTAEQIVHTALQEDADLIGVADVTEAEIPLLEHVTGLLRERDAEDIVVFVQGAVSGQDSSALADLGIAKLFDPGTPTREVVAWVTSQLREG